MCLPSLKKKNKNGKERQSKKKEKNKESGWRKIVKKQKKRGKRRWLHTFLWRRIK